MTFNTENLALAESIVTICTGKSLRLATAESCTGGLISACLTEIPGSSAVLDRGFVVYSNRAKHELLGVPAALLERHGAVSKQVASAMAAGALQRSGTNIAIAVTGVAGPSGGTAAKPVGLVHLALASDERVREVRAVFEGDRHAVRSATLDRALAMILDAVS